MTLILGFLAGALACSTPLYCLAAPETSSPPLELLGIHIGQPSEDVRQALGGKASFEKEEEGQQVWRTLHEPSMQYVILGFDREHRVRYITALAASGGPPLACAPLGDPDTAAKTGKEGNVELRREVKEQGQDLTIVARGASSSRLASCSIKKQGAGGEQEEEQEEQRVKSKR